MHCSDLFLPILQCDNIVYLFIQVVIAAENGKNDESFVAVDEFTFLQTDVCDFMPSEAVPTEPPTTPTPTEPPGRKFLIYLKSICSSGFPFKKEVAQKFHIWTQW